MGGNSSSGGGEGPRNQYQKAKKKNILQKAADKSIVLRTIKGIGEKLGDAARPYNVKRRKEFISKYNTSVPVSERINMTDEEIGSSKGLASLRDVGYKTVTDLNTSGGGNDNQDKSMEQPKVASQMDNTGVKSKMIIADKTSPTTAEMTEDERLIATKRKGRRTTMLTDIKEDTKPTLSKKVLLG